MLFVAIEALPGTLDLMQKESLKGFLREACPRLFSLPDRELKMTDVSIVFPVLEEESEPMCNVIVRVRLDADPQRLQFAPMHALELQSNITETVISADPQHKELRAGVSLDYGTEITWCDDSGPV